MAPSYGGPDGALLQINRFCNLACSHCSHSAPPLQRGSPVKELALSDWTRILSRLREAGITQVRFTGGEPFVRDDLQDLCRAARAMNLDVSFVTNGLAILPDNILWLKEVQPKAIWVSLYGYPAEVYERVAGRRGVFARVMRTVESLVDERFNVGLYYPLGDVNADGAIPFIRDFYALGVRRIKFVQILKHGRAALADGPFPLADNYLSRLLDETVEAAVSCRGLVLKVSMLSGQTALFRSKGFLVPDDRTCHAGLHKLWTVDSQGWALPCCLFLEKQAGRLLNVRSKPQFARWQSWGRTRTLAQLGWSSDPPKSCPALGPDSGEPENDFICPLMYAELHVP